MSRRRGTENAIRVGGERPHHVERDYTTAHGAGSGFSRTFGGKRGRTQRRLHTEERRRITPPRHRGTEVRSPKRRLQMATLVELLSGWAAGLRPASGIE